MNKEIKRKHRFSGIFALFLTVALVLTGCTDKPADSETETSVQNSEQTVPEETEEASVEETSPASSTEEEETATGISDSEAEELIGSITDKTYSNLRFHLQYTLPDTYEYADESKLLEENGFDTEKSFKAQAAVSWAMKDAPVVVMHAFESGSSAYDGADNAIIEIIYTGETFSEDDLRSYVESEAALVAEQYAVGAGASDTGADSIGTKVEKKETEFSGENRQTLSFTAEISGIRVYERIMFLIRDQYLALVILGSPDESRLDSMASQFIKKE